MSQFALGNLFLVASIGCAGASQTLLKLVLRDMPASAGWRTVRGGLALGLVVVGFGCWLAALARLDLSYAYPIACSSILLVAVLSAVVLGEPLTPRMWAGSLLVLVGVALLTPRG